MSDTRTGPLVQKLVDGLQEDLGEAVESLRKGRALIRALEGETRGVNGLSALLKGKGSELDKIIQDLEEESVAIEKKLLGSPRPEIVQTVNLEKVAEIQAAKAAG